MDPLGTDEFLLTVNSNRIVPAQLFIVCGHCGQRATYTPSASFAGTGHSFWLADFPCAHPKCQKRITVIARTTAENTGERPQVWVWPSRNRRSPITGLDHVPQLVRQTYIDTLEAFNNTEIQDRVILNQARVVLEAIAHAVIPDVDDDQLWRLSELLRKMPEHTDFAAPILEAARAVKAGGDKGSHFSPNLKVGPQHRVHMMDLLEALLEYVFVIPHQTQAAHTAFLEMAGIVEAAPPSEPFVGYAYLPPDLRRRLANKAKAEHKELADFVRETLDAASRA